MEAYSTQVIELLSLGKTSEGVHQLKVAVTQEDRVSIYMLEIDELTFLGIEAVQPLRGGRARLSPYAKWDPYRSTYYSSIIRTTGMSRETLYFLCSEEYIKQIKQLKQNPSSHSNQLLEESAVEQADYGNMPNASKTRSSKSIHKNEDGAGDIPPEAPENYASTEPSPPSKRENTKRRTRPFHPRSRRLPRVAGLLLAGVMLLIVLGICSRNTAGSVSVFGMNANAVPGIEAAKESGLLTAKETVAFKGSDNFKEPVTSKGSVTSKEPVASKESITSKEAVVPALASAKNSGKQEVPLTAEKGEQRGTPAVLSGQTTSATKEQAGNQQQAYEVFSLDEGKKLFGLPKGYVALTFDDGPSRYTEKIVDTLTANKVAATFLFVGENAKHKPDAVAYASGQGMSIGNHSWDHQELTKVGPKEQAQNLSKTVSLLESLTDTPVTLFRPPYGAIDDGLFAEAKQEHMKTLMWNRDPEDWNHKKAQDIVQYFHSVEASGGIYVLHEDKSTVEALPDIIKYLQDKELKFVIFK